MGALLMCGIAGLLRTDGAPPDLGELAAMSAALAHRGPDGCGTWAGGPVALAARRLALLDPARGEQPVLSEDGAVVAVLNGELYEHAALRRRLRQAGHVLATTCDTELVPHLVEERGAAAFEGLRGMFAAAVWDGRARRLLLARDPFGIKPLLWTRRGPLLAFASELRALLALPWVARTLDPAALDGFFACGAVMAPRTVVAGVHRLPAGHLLVAAGGAVRVAPFARPAPRPPRQAGVAALGAEARARLARSVALHARADRPVGLLLSGGLDSGLLCALAGGALPTFTVGFDDPGFDELPAARAVAARWGTEHHEALLTGADAARLLPAVARAMDEPRADATALAYWALARLAAGRVTAALSGEGADELFGGYQTYAADRLGPPAPLAARLLLPLAERVPASGARLGADERVRRLARGAGLPPLERHHAWKELVPAAARDRLLGRPALLDPLQAHRARWAQTRGAGRLARLQDVDLGTFLADDLLLQADRAGMAHGLEVRTPYLDREVAALALALPAGARVRGLATTKPVLRAAARGLLPDATVRGEKRGFVVPAARWLRGPLRALSREVLAPEVLRGHGVLDPAAVAALLARHDARREDLARPLWAAIALTLWIDAHLRGAPRVAPGRPDSVTRA